MALPAGSLNAQQVLRDLDARITALETHPCLSDILRPEAEKAIAHLKANAEDHESGPASQIANDQTIPPGE